MARLACEGVPRRPERAVAKMASWFKGRDKDDDVGPADALRQSQTHLSNSLVAEMKNRKTEALAGATPPHHRSESLWGTSTPMEIQVNTGLECKG